MNAPEDTDDDERPSKSARKREHRALQDLVEELAALPEAHLRLLPLSERAREALQRTRTMARDGARNRQIRLTAQLLLDEDLERLREAAREPQRRTRAETALHHAAENLRAQLLTTGVRALDGLDASPAQLEHAARLYADANSPGDGVRARTAHRELYRLARTLLGARNRV